MSLLLDSSVFLETIVHFLTDYKKCTKKVDKKLLKFILDSLTRAANAKKVEIT